MELLWRAAPEQVSELDQLFADQVQARLLKGSAPELGVTFNVLQIPEKMLKQLWLLAHSAWQHFLGFDALKKGHEAAHFRLTAQRAVQSAKELSSSEAIDWPHDIPQFGQKAEGTQAKATRELYAMAGAWAIAHEMQHAKFYENETCPENDVAEELACDQYAANFLFDKINSYVELTGESAVKVRDKRAMSALVGLYFVAMLSPETQQTESHPAVSDRMRLLFDKASQGQLEHFWTFATGLLWGVKEEIATAQVPLPNPSGRDLAYFALEKAFEGQTV